MNTPHPIESIRKRLEAIPRGATIPEELHDSYVLLEALETANAKVGRYEKALQRIQDQWLDTKDINALLNDAENMREIAHDALENPKQDTCLCHCHNGCPGANGGTKIGDAIANCLCYPRNCEHCKPQPHQECEQCAEEARICYKHQAGSSKPPQQGATIDREKLDKVIAKAKPQSMGENIALFIRSILT